MADFDLMCPAHPHVSRQPYARDLQATDFPSYLYYYSVRVNITLNEVHLDELDVQLERRNSLRQRGNFFYVDDQSHLFVQSKYFYRLNLRISGSSGKYLL